MEFYNQYTDDISQLEYGELSCEIDKYFVNDIEVINNRAIPGDIVYLKDNELVGIKKRNNSLIVGILHLSRNQKYGFNKRNIPYYKFTSISHKYPSFIVPSKSKLKKSLYCVIKFNKWETTNKHPIGQIEYLIGPVGEIENEISMLLYYTQIYPKKNKTLYLDNKVYNNIDYNTYSIDPKGCKDIDDALHFKRYDDKIEIGIHIANVARYIEKLDLNCYSTIYLKNKQINMLSNDITFNKCSLGNGEPKKALSLLLTYQDTRLIKTEFKETIVKNTPMSYQETNILIDSKQDHELYKLYKFTLQLMKIDDIESTKMVEYFMLQYNTILAEKLYEYNRNTILRTHVVNQIKLTNIDYELRSYLGKINQQAAVYESNPLNTYHQDLNFKYYTHATSPIRRYVDIINQKNMINLLEKQEFIKEDKLDDINLFQKKLRKFYNLYKKLKIIFDIPNHQELYCYIIKISNLKMSIFIPELDIEHSFMIISNKLVDSNKITIDESSITINDTKFNLYDKIKIKLTPLPYEDKFNKKLHVEIMEPSFMIS
jgi:exoribonuclease R